MHKCEVCGSEFDSKFCPNCGTPAPLEACPDCGAPLAPGNKFCPACGRRLTVQQPWSASDTKAAQDVRGTSPALVKLCSFLPYAIPVLFALFSVLLFLLFLGDVSTVMGFGTGNIYRNTTSGIPSDEFNFLSGGMSEGADGDPVSRACRTLVILASIGAVFAVGTLAFRFYIPLRIRAIGKVRIYTLFEGGCLVFCFTDFLFGCILCGAVSDEITSPGAGPVCVLVFSLLFFLLFLGIALVNIYLPKLLPAVDAELKAQTARRHAALTPPAAPERKVLKRPKKQKKQKKYCGGECSEELKIKLQKHLKAKTLFMIFAALIFPFLGIGILFLGFAIYDTGDPASLYTLFYTFIGVYGISLILCGILGIVYYKKVSTRFDWQKKRVWNNAAMFVTTSVYSFLFVIVFPFNNLGGDEPVSLYKLMIFPACFIYIFVTFLIAGMLTRKGRKYSLAVYGVKHPKLSPEVQENARIQYKQQMSYLAQKEFYRAARKQQRAAWRKYRRDLAYFKAGYPPRTASAFHAR